MQRTLPDGTGVVDRNRGAVLLSPGGESGLGAWPATRTKSAAASRNNTIPTAAIAYSGFHRFMVATAGDAMPLTPAVWTRSEKEAPSGASVSCRELLSYLG